MFRAAHNIITLDIQEKNMLTKFDLMCESLQRLNRYQKMALWGFKFPDKDYCSPITREELKKEKSRIRMMKLRKDISMENFNRMIEEAKTDNEKYIEEIAKDYLIIPEHKVKELAMLKSMESIHLMSDDTIKYNLKPNFNSDEVLRIIRKFGKEVNYLVQPMIKDCFALMRDYRDDVTIEGILSPIDGIEVISSVFTDNGVIKTFHIYRIK